MLYHYFQEFSTLAKKLLCGFAEKQLQALSF